MTARCPRPDRHLIALCLLLAAVATLGASAPRPTFDLPVEEIVLDNGFRLLVLERPRQANVEAGWVLDVGSYADPQGAAGMSHLVEHALFKGTRKIGTRDYRSESPLLAEEDRLVGRIAKLPAGPKRRRLEQLLATTRAEARSFARLGELSLLYSEAGAVGLNAHTFKDFAAHLVTLPAEKVELWFWLESDRLSNPVLREFYSEIDVILEERRQRLGSTPTGVPDEALDERFWHGSGYAHRPIGRADELRNVTRADALTYLDQWLRPNRLTAVLVGPVSGAQVRPLAERYFGRLGAAAVEAAGPTALAAARGQSKRWQFECECPTQLRVLYPAPEFRHRDSYSLQVLAGILNGRAGRLHQALVLGTEQARSASAHHQPYRRAGFFRFQAVTKGDHTPDDLLEAWYRMVEALHATPPTATELSMARNQLAADAFRRLRDPAILRTQLLVYAGLGEWREISAAPERLLSVSAADVQRVARAYLRADRQTVGIYRGPNQ